MLIKIMYAVLSLLAGFFVMYKAFPYLLDFITEKSKNRGFHVGPWKTHLGVGRPDTSRIEKAAIVRVGLGANSSDETIYWNAFTDSNGETLSSVNNYVISLDENLPIDFKNKGFWSITVYGADKFLVNNVHKKYMIRTAGDDYHKLVFPLEIQLGKPESTLQENYIPIPANPEKFSIALRCYRPLEEMKNTESCSKINFPKIIRINE